MPRYIDADLILYKTVAYPVFDFATGMVHTELLKGEYAKREEIEAIPTVDAQDVQEVVHAKFERINCGKGICNNCHRLDSIDNIAKYCRYCCARMDGDEK